MGQGVRMQRDTVLQFNEAPGLWCLFFLPSNGMEFWEPASPSLTFLDISKLPSLLLTLKEAERLLLRENSMGGPQQHQRKLASAALHAAAERD